MKKIITLFFIGSLMTSIISTAVAQGGANKTTYTVNNLTPELNAIVELVKKECVLNPNQTIKFKNDYVLFLNENAKPNANTSALLFLLGTKIKPYLNETQFAKVVKMGQDGKLKPKNTTTTTTKPDAQNTASLTPKPGVSNAPLSLAVTTQSNVTELFQQLQSYLKVPSEKATQILPILKDYDQQLSKIKTENAGNAGKIKQLSDALNGQVVPKLKAHMTDEQIGILVLALGMQENILSGKNLSPDQKIFLDKIRTQYKLNDVQTMSVILVLVQGKIRADVITLLYKTNPQQAGQEFITLMQDLDSQLKSSLNNDQYQKVKSDIEKLIKGQKL